MRILETLAVSWPGIRPGCKERLSRDILDAGLGREIASAPKSMGPINPQGVQPVAPRPSWWSRNWMWFVPTGCLSIALLGAAFFCAILMVVFGALKSTDVYKTALKEAQANSAVTEALGTPIKDGMFLSGNTNVNGPSGQADIAIPISGPKGSGTIYAVATKSAGKWTYTKLEVEIKATGERIPLQAAAGDE